ncbi:MAG TPA: hypothetical protein VNN73_01670 [Blastocatellia bacterium]|nr:hypothetical protein [Blastocatellia bacterium]
MSTKFIAIVLAAVIAAAGVLAISNSGSSSRVARNDANGQVVKTALAADSEASSEAFISDFKSGYADGFNAGVAGLSYPDQASMTSNARGYLDGFSQGYTDGQNQQSNLRSKLCGNTAEYSTTSGVYGSRSYRSSRVASSRVLGDRYYERREVDRGIGSTARKALLIAGGAAIGAGLGGAFGGKKGAIIGALVGGGAGTVGALTHHPRRAFSRHISGKSVAVKSLIGAGAGAAIGALAGGKRGALAGAALGGGGGVLWSLLSGRRTYRR